jgi:hypothetical protein
MLCRTHNKPSDERFLWSTGLNIITDNLYSIVEMVSAILYSHSLNNLTCTALTMRNIEVDWHYTRRDEKGLRLIILMGQVRKDIWDCWSTDLMISTHIFPNTMSRNRFETIWQTSHFGDNSQKTQVFGRFFKIQPVYKYLFQKFRSVYSPEKDEAMIPWRDQLK